LPVEAEVRERLLRSGQVPQGDVLELLLEIVALDGELRELLLGLRDLAFLVRNLLLDGGDARLRVLEDLVALGLRLLAFLDLLRPVLPLGVVVVVERVVVEVAPLFEVALDEAEVQVLLEILELERLDLLSAASVRMRP
jgi:hypothetical protein